MLPSKKILHGGNNWIATFRLLYEYESINIEEKYGY